MHSYTHPHVSSTLPVIALTHTHSILVPILSIIYPQIMGIQMSPPPAETPPTQAQTLPTQAQTPPTQVQTPPTAVEPGSSGSSGAAGSPRETEGAAGSRKRQHPDSGDNTLGDADIVSVCIVCMYNTLEHSVHYVLRS